MVYMDVFMKLHLICYLLCWFIRKAETPLFLLELSLVYPVYFHESGRYFVQGANSPMTFHLFYIVLVIYFKMTVILKSSTVYLLMLFPFHRKQRGPTHYHIKPCAMLLGNTEVKIAVNNANQLFGKRKMRKKNKRILHDF